MSIERRLDTIDAEINLGYKSKAAEKLRIMINQYPNDISLRGRLALLYYECGFTDAAGKYWMLTEPTQDHIKKAVEVYKKSINYSSQKILNDIKFRGDRALISAYAKLTLEELEKDKAVVNLRSFKTYANRKKPSPTTTSSSLSEIGCYGLLLLTGLILIVGLVTVLQAIHGIFINISQD